MKISEIAQPLHEINIKAKISSHHHVLLLVFLYEGVPDLASFDILLGAHGVRLASQTWVFPVQAWLAQGGWLVFYQAFLYQTVPRRLKDVQGITLDTTLEKATSFYTVFCKTGLLL